MIANAKSFPLLTANDVMSRDVILIPQEMSLPVAARLLSQHHISGAPVVDADGRCIGVLSTTDFLQWAQKTHEKTKATFLPSACHCPWELVSVDDLPPDRVGTFMTKDPVTVERQASITKLARTMLDAHIHRVIVVDKAGKPIGVISSTDILAAVASSVSEPHSRCPEPHTCTPAAAV